MTDEQRKKEFLDYLQKAPHVEFYSVEKEWADSATMGLRVDFALTRAGEEG